MISFLLNADCRFRFVVVSVDLFIQSVVLSIDVLHIIQVDWERDEHLRIGLLRGDVRAAESTNLRAILATRVTEDPIVHSLIELEREDLLPLLQALSRHLVTLPHFLAAMTSIVGSHVSWNARRSRYAGLVGIGQA